MEKVHAVLARSPKGIVFIFLGWALMEFIGLWMNSNRFLFCGRILMGFFWMKFDGIDVSMGLILIGPIFWGIILMEFTFCRMNFDMFFCQTKTSQPSKLHFFPTGTPGCQICTCPRSRLLLVLVQGFCQNLASLVRSYWCFPCLCPWVLSSPSGHPCMEFPPLLSPAGAAALLWPLAWHPWALFLVAVGLQMSWTHHLWTHPLNPLFGCPGLGVALLKA